MIIVSACLAGVECRYDGQSKSRSDLVELVAQGKAIAVCPEELGGLPTPRPPSEQVGDRVFSCHGDDVTNFYHSGAQRALQVALETGGPIDKAILKSHSPMCGCGSVYDGTFSGKKTEGDGVFTTLLKEKGIKVEPRD